VSTSNLAGIEDELYGLPLQEFTAARDAAVSEARRQGDRSLTQSVKALRKPSVAAWLANMLVRERGAEIERLIGLGETLRSSRHLDGDQIRAATKQKLASVRKLLRHAEATAGGKDQPVSQAVLLELEVTLDAAFSDPVSAASLRTGQLTGTLHYSGLGFGSDRAPTSAPSRLPGSESQAPASTTTKARKELEEATRAAARADAEADMAKQALVRAEADLKRLRAASAVAGRKAKKARQVASAAQRKYDSLKGAGPR
jgi:hypothetical protein